jgi:mycothiol synthase
MKLIQRSYLSEDDYNRIRDFLRDVFLVNDRRMFSWPIARLDYWRWHGIFNLQQGVLERDVFLWETEDRQIAAVLNREEAGQAFLQVHPAHKTVDLERQLITQAEENLSTPSRRGGSVLWIWTDSGDTERIQLLKRRGYSHISESDEHQWRRSLLLPIPEVSLREGYAIRPLGDASELPSRSWASWRAFHSNEPDENYQGDWKWYLNIQAAPLYQQDLDLVAISPQGEVAAFTTIWYDEITRCGYFEPVGTVPEHQRRGLARALLFEGMKQLKLRGATQCMVAGGSKPANTLYQAVIGPVFDLYQPWEKRWQD